MSALRRLAAIYLLPVLVCLLCGPICSAVEYPGPVPGAAKAAIENNLLRLENNILAVEWRIDAGHLLPNSVEDKQSKIKTPVGGELFELVFADGKTIPTSEMTIEGWPVCEEIAADPNALRAGDHFTGKRITATLTDKNGTLRVRWQAVLRDGANYVRQRIVIEPQKEKGDRSNLCAAPGGPFRQIGPVPFFPAEIVLLNLPAPGAKRIGESLGSPVVAGNLFFACENPLADNQGADGRVCCRLQVGTEATLASEADCREREVPKQRLGTRKTAYYRSVIGVAPPDQMRRAFLRYVERERPRPYQPFLHYNCYYDISWACRKFNEQQALEAIELFGREFIQKRGVKLDSFVFDNGWDDPSTLWGFHDGFPNGFVPLRDAAAKYGSNVGVWLSPCGGGGSLAKARRDFGRKQGFELNAHGLSPAGSKYYARFRQVCLGMIENCGANLFKFDDFGIGNTAVGKPFRRPKPDEAADIEAMMRLIADLRAAQPGVYISTTVGTWPSPFWLWHGDSIWRNGSDMDFCGDGRMRQQWISYRDSVAQEMTGRRAPLFPMNSVMLHGFTYARLGTPNRLAADLKDVKDEIRTLFASGTQLQELYVTPGMMSPETWDALAEAAKWSRANADVLVDTHFFGGNASKSEVYGYASWSPRKGIVALRNPSGKPASFMLNLNTAWELPPEAPRKYSLKSPWKEDADKAAISVLADKDYRIDLRPFQVMILETNDQTASLSSLH